MVELNNLRKLVAEAEIEGAKFYGKGNASAGTRLRKSLLAIRREADALRKGVSEAKNKQA